MDPERLYQLLRQRRIGYLCTSGPQNRPHITPIFIIYSSKNYKIYFQTNRDTKKVRDILANPQVSITIDSRDVVNPFKNEGVMIQGDAEVLEEELGKVIPEEMGIALDVFREKFVDVVTKGGPGDKVVVMVNIHKLVHWMGPRFQSITI